MGKNTVYIVRTKGLAQKLKKLLDDSSSLEIIEVNEDNLIKTAGEMAVRERNQKRSDSSSLVLDILEKMGFRNNLSGYQYIIDAVLLFKSWEETDKKSIMRVYLELSNIYHTTPSCVERSMRYSIKTAWESGNRSAFREVLGDYFSMIGSSCPSNSNLIEGLTMYQIK